MGPSLRELGSRRGDPRLLQQRLGSVRRPERVVAEEAPHTLRSGHQGDVGVHLHRWRCTPPPCGESCRRRAEMTTEDVQLSSADRVLFPEDGITKGDLFEYYRH